MKNLINISTHCLFMLFVLFAISACSDLKEELKVVRQKSNEGKPCEFANVCNPYYEYGEAHNEVVNHVMEQQDEIIALAEDEAQLRVIVAEKTEEFLQTLEMDDPNYYASAEVDWEDFYEAGLTDQEFLLEASDLTDYEQQTLVGFFDQLPSFDLNTDEGLASLISYTEDLECALQEDDQITNQVAVSTSLAVTKYSASLWTNDINLPQTEGIIGIIVSDAFGAFFGHKKDLEKKKKRKRMLAYAAAFSLTMGLSILI